MLSSDTITPAWKDYKATYHDSMMGLKQTEFQTLITREVLREFPGNLPEHLKETLINSLVEIGKTALKGAHVAEEGKEGSFSIPTSKNENDQRLLDLTTFFTLRLWTLEKGKTKETKEVIQQGFERIISSQTLVMVFAHIDAFLADTVRTICFIHPEILRNEKKIDWATAIAFENKEQLLEYLRESFVLEFGSPNLSKRIEYLSKNLGVEIDRTKIDLELLDIAENTRHIIIHNGGKVSQEFLKRTKRTDVKTGDFIPIDFAYADLITKSSHHLITEVFGAVARKFFGVKESDLHTLS